VRTKHHDRTKPIRACWLQDEGEGRRRTCASTARLCAGRVSGPCPVPELMLRPSVLLANVAEHVGLGRVVPGADGDVRAPGRTFRSLVKPPLAVRSCAGCWRSCLACSRNSGRMAALRPAHFCGGARRSGLTSCPALEPAAGRVLRGRLRKPQRSADRQAVPSRCCATTASDVYVPPGASAAAGMVRRFGHTAVLVETAADICRDETCGPCWPDRSREGLSHCRSENRRGVGC